MGAGYRGNFGKTKGSKFSIAAKDYNPVIVVRFLSTASKEIKEMAKYSPIDIPTYATYIKQNKKGYKQIKYEWENGEYNYISRYHTTPPSSKKYTNEKETWVVERKIKGIGYGKNARKSKEEVYIRNLGWISKSKWKELTYKRHKGVLTEEEKEVLDNGHWSNKK